MGVPDHVDAPVVEAVDVCVGVPVNDVAGVRVLVTDDVGVLVIVCAGVPVVDAVAAGDPVFVGVEVKLGALYTVNFRNRLFVESYKYTLLEASTDNAVGYPNCAVVASAPSPANPHCPPIPATVLMILVEALTKRTTQLEESKISKLPTESTPTS